MTAPRERSRVARSGRPGTRRFFVLALAFCSACASPAGTPALPAVRAWAIQLQGFDRPGALRALETSAYDMLVLDAPDSVRGQEAFDTRALIDGLRPRLVFAYLNVGQSEQYRVTWDPRWRAPAGGRAGEPAFLLGLDPEGWEGDFPVAYWDPAWRRVVLARVARLARLGFDGVSCDWVLGFEHDAVVAAARRDGVDPRRAMANLLESVKREGSRVRPGFLLLMQNGGALLRTEPGLRPWVDGYIQECVSFRGRAGAGWDDPEAGDIALPETGEWSTQALLKQLQFVRGLGLPTFTIDYARDPAHAGRARERARSVLAVPFVTRTPLDRLP